MGHNNNNKPATKPLSKRQQLEQLLGTLSSEELQSFVIQTALYDRSLYETLMINFADRLSDADSDQQRYQHKLNNILSKYTLTNGYISYQSATPLCSAITKLLETARKATTPTHESIDVAMAVINILPQIGNQMDDPHEQLYALTQLACTVLQECYDSASAPKQQQCFDDVLAMYGQTEYLDLDLDSALLALLMDWSQQNEPYGNRLLGLLDKLIANCLDDQWQQQYLTEQKRSIIAILKPD